MSLKGNPKSLRKQMKVDRHFYRKGKRNATFLTHFWRQLRLKNTSTKVTIQHSDGVSDMVSNENAIDNVAIRQEVVWEVSRSKTLFHIFQKFAYAGQ